MTVAVNVPPAATLAVAATAPPASIETVAPSGSAARPDSAYGLPAPAGSFAAFSSTRCTATSPRIDGCSWQKYGTVPGASKRWSNVPDISSRGDAKLPSSALTLCARSESLCHVTVSPASTSRCGVANEAL